MMSSPFRLAYPLPGTPVVEVRIERTISRSADQLLFDEPVNDPSLSLGEIFDRRRIEFVGKRIRLPIRLDLLVFA
jgi:hypothetical protein